MKRIFFIIATSTLMSIAAQAQQPAKTFSITPKVGISVGGLTGDPFFNTATVVYMWPSSFDQSADDLRTPEISSHSTQKHSTQIGFAGGIEAQYQFNRYLGIVLGATYRHASVDYKYENTPFPYKPTSQFSDVYKYNGIKDANWNADYLGVPVMLSVYIWRGLAVKAGLQMDWMFHEDADATIDYSSTSDDLIVLNYSSIYDSHKISMSIPVGLSYEYKNIVFDARYNIGASDIAKSSWPWVEDPYCRTRAFNVTLGYKFVL